MTYAEVIKGPVVHEVHQYSKPGWVNQVIRVYPTDPDVEFEWLVGPIPISDGIGKKWFHKNKNNEETTREPLRRH